MMHGKSTGFAALVLLTAVIFAACGGGGGGGSSSTLPVVTTGSATSSTYNTATMNGSVNPKGYPTKAWFAYGTSSTLANNTVTDNVAMGAGTAEVALTPVAVSGLSGDTTYYYALVAESSQGKVLGEIRSFTTPAQPPTVTTDDGTPTAHNAATVHGTVNPNGYATYAWFEYGTDNTFASKLIADNVSRGSGVADVAATAGLTGLTENTTYYYRFVGASSAGTTYGAIKNFKTPELGGPLADAGSDQTVYMRGPFGTQVGRSGATVVSLDGSGSVDSDAGTITAYAWTQLSGTTVTLSHPADVSPTFTVPQLAYGETEDLVFQLEVTDDSGLKSSANVTVRVIYGFLDDFSVDTTGEYSPTGTGTLAYGTGVASITTGSGIYKSMSKEFYWSTGTSPGGKGTFSIDYKPTFNFGSGGVTVKLGVTPTTYYYISTIDGVAQKIYSDNVVSSANFTATCGLNTTSTISMVYDWNDTTVNVCGTSVTLPHESVDHAISEIYFTVTVSNMNAELDNFKFIRNPAQ